MVPNRSKVGNDRKSEKIKWDLNECPMIEGRSTQRVLKLPNEVQRQYNNLVSAWQLTTEMWKNNKMNLN